MRVLMVNLGYAPNVIGGAELMVQSLARDLAGQGLKLGVVSLSQNDQDWQYQDGDVRAYFIAAHPMGIALLDPSRRAAKKLLWHAIGEFNPWTSRKFAAILEAERPSVVHTHNLIGLSLAPWRVAHARGVPIVHTLHDYQLLCPRGTMFRVGAACARPCGSCRLLTARRRSASALPSIAVGVSQFILDTHSAGGYFPNAAKIVIANGIGPLATGAAQHRRGNEGAPLRIGFIGRLHPTKGIELLLDALRLLPQGSYRALIAGSGNASYAAAMKTQASGLAVEFPGWISREAFYDAIDVLVVPSVYAEPQGLVLLEAASFGVPVLYSKRGGLAEMGAAFADFIAFEPEAQSLRHAIAQFAARPAATARRTATKRTIPSPFTAADCVSGYRHLYESLQARSPSAAIAPRAQPMKERRYPS